MRAIEDQQHQDTGRWPFAREQLFITDVMDVEDTAAGLRLFDQAVASELGFEAYQIADSWRLPEGFAWQ